MRRIGKTWISNGWWKNKIPPLALSDAKGPRIGSSWHMRQKLILGDAGGQLIFKIIIIAQSNISNGRKRSWWILNGTQLRLRLWNTTIINVLLLQQKESQTDKNQEIEFNFGKNIEKTQTGITRPNLGHFRSWGGESLFTEALLPPQKEWNQELLFAKVTFLLLFH